MPHDSVRIDHIGYSSRYQAERFGHAEGFAQQAIAIAEQMVGKSMVGCKILMLLHVVRADTDNHSPGIGKILIGIAKGTGFFSADRRLIGRVKKEDDCLFSPEISQSNLLTMLSVAENSGAMSPTAICFIRPLPPASDL